jgi:uncharacterized coiled-coil protein SlyX
MNVSISMNVAEVQESIDTAMQEKVDALTRELDLLFRGKIKTPEQVIFIYNKLNEYKRLSGLEYKITFEENTIV